MSSKASVETVPSEKPALSNVLRNVLEQSGELNKIRAMIQSQVLEIVRGHENSPITMPPKDTTDPDSIREVLNKLIMEYLHWSGLIYSADMFASECGMEHQPPPRMNLELIVGNYPMDMPILLSLIEEISK